MAIGDLVPWRWGGLRRIEEDQSFDAFRRDMEALHRNIDRLFEGAWNGGSLLADTWARSPVVPRIDVSEDDKAFHVSVELPGIDEKDISVSLAERTLTISGEKKEEKEKKDKDVHRRERAYGSFRRTMQLPAEVDTDKIAATFKKGVLAIDLPKSEQIQQKTKRIEVKAA